MGRLCCVFVCILSEARPAAVAFEFFAVYIAGLVAGKEQNRVRQVLRHGKLAGEVQELTRPAEAELVGRAA